MKRRVFLKNSLTALALTGTGAAGFSIWNNNKFIGSVFAAEPSPALPIPPLLENLDKSGQSAQFQLRVQQGAKSFFPGLDTRTYGYNGNFLGPTIRVRNNQRFNVRVDNGLTEETTVHWHGVHLPAEWDGGPRQPIAAGSSWSPDFTIKQEAATLWYHPHAMDLTGEQVYKGLAGLFIVEDEVSDELDLPRTYGVDDIPIILQDRRFYRDGEFAYVHNMHDIINGVVGSHLLVNGAISPTLKATSKLLRLRLLNGSNSSIYTMSFSGLPQFHVVASDGGFLERPVAMTSIVLSAGERAEVILDLSSLTSDQTTLMVDQRGGNQFTAMTIQRAQTLNENTMMPERIKQVERIPESEATRTRTFVMETMGMGMGMRMGGQSRLTINGQKMDLNRIDARVQLGSTEIWEIENRTAMMMNMPHSMHLHDVQFQILDRNGKPPAAHELGRKDTVLFSPGERVRIIMRFQDYKGIYMFHCHLLEHEDDGMMGQFEVV